MSADKYLTYRGDIKALAAVGGAVVFVTAHPEGQPTAVHRLDADTFALTADPLPCGGTALAVAGDTLWVAGSDNKLYRGPADKGNLTAVGELPAPALALTVLSDDRLAGLVGNAVHILERQSGRSVQMLELPEPGTALAADPTGTWLAVGTSGGTVSVFEREGRPDFQLSDSGKLHEAAVTAILFETDELRFLSAGADGKLLTTHARGKLEPEDRGRGANHSEPITAMIWGPGDRFLTGSLDASVKSWPRQGAARPVTLKDGVAKVVALAVPTVHGKPVLVAACTDNTLRFFTFDEDGRFGEATVRAHDAYARAEQEMARPESARREEVLRSLAGYGDKAAMELIAARMKQDDDHALRLLSAQLLSAASHARAAQLLEGGLQHRDEAVRLASFQGLRRHLGETSLRPLTLALRADKADVGIAAVRALEGLAGRDEQALTRLTDALDAKVSEVRQAALDSLEKVYPADSPEADLTALGSQHADVRRRALVRLYQRKLLDRPPVEAALRRRGEDADPEVRRTSFLLSLHTRPKLARALRGRDPELERQLTELESGQLTSDAPTGPPAADIPPHLRQQLEAMAQRQGIPAERVLEEVGKVVGSAKGPSGLLTAIVEQLQEIIRRARGQQGEP